jgi:hypothetical protein
MQKYVITFKKNGSRRSMTRTIEASSASMAIEQLKGSYSNEDTFEIVSVEVKR